MGSQLLLRNSKKSGRPKSGWTQADTARELGISQQSVSNAIQAAKVVEAIPALAKFKTTTILRTMRALRKPDTADFAKFSKDDWDAFHLIVERF